MQAILRLFPDHGVGGVHQLGADFLAPVGRQAVHVQRVAGGAAHQLGVDLVAGEYLRPVALLLLLPHGGPDIGYHQVRAGRCLQRFVLDAHPVGVGGQQPGVGLEARRAGDAQLEVELPGGVDIGLAHIVAVSHPADGLAGDGAALLYPGLHIRQQLAGVVLVRQGIDDRYPGLGGKALDDVVAEGADHHDIHHGGDHPRAVLYRLPPPQLGVLGGQEHGVPSQLGHARLE